MCLLCSGVLCCVPFKPLSVCWSSMAQINGKELCKSENEDPIEAVKSSDQPVVADVIRRSCATPQEPREQRKVYIKNTAVPDVLERSSEKIKSLAVLTKNNNLLDCSSHCCLVPSLKSSKRTHNITVYQSCDTERDFVQSINDVRRGSDPGLKVEDSSGKKRHKSHKSSRQSMSPREKYKSQSQKYELNTSVVFVDERKCGLPRFDHYSSNIITTTTTHRTSEFDVNAFNFFPRGRNEEYAILESNSGGATLRRPFITTRSDTAASRENVSEMSTYFSRHVSPHAIRKKVRTSTRSCRSRDVSQTTGSADVLVMDNPIFACAAEEGCDATTQTEWSNGWEPLPTEYLTLFRHRLEQRPGPGLTTTSAVNDDRTADCNGVDQKAKQACGNITNPYNDAAASTSAVVSDVLLDTRVIESSKHAAEGWGSMDNLGFLSSGESSDQTRTSNQTSSTNYQRYRAKDDWAVYKASRNEDYYNLIPRYQSDTSLDREMAQLSQEMACIQLECEVLVSRHINERMKAGGSNGADVSVAGPSRADLPSTSFQQPRFFAQVHRNIPTTLSFSSRLNTVGDRVPHDSVNNWMRGYESHPDAKNAKSSSDEEEDEKTSSSAYNTGESSGSTAMGQDGSNTSGEFKKSLMTLITKNKATGLETCCKADTANRCDCQKRQDKETKTSDKSSPGAGGIVAASTQSQDSMSPAFSPGTIMYTNEAHLQHTIILQQQLLRKALSMSGGCEPKHRCNLQSPIINHQDILGSRYISCQEDDSSASKTAETEWRVKRRPDGTRYITRRPSRTKILKERALRISEERRGLTTDDDATSELKLGRYWSKEERKRHLERARERRKKEVVSGKSKLAMVRESRVSLVVVQEEEPLVSPGCRKSLSGKYSPLHPALTKITNCSKVAKTSALLSVTTV